MSVIPPEYGTDSERTSSDVVLSERQPARPQQPGSIHPPEGASTAPPRSAKPKVASSVPLFQIDDELALLELGTEVETALYEERILPWLAVATRCKLADLLREAA